MGKTIIARKDSLFDTYINNTADYLAAGGPPSNGARLGLTALEITGWDGFRDNWNTQYGLYTDLNTRTKTIKDNKNNIKKDSSPSPHRCSNACAPALRSPPQTGTRLT